MKAKEVAAALGNPSREGRGWRCRCPIHDGVSLNVADGDGGRLLVTCWADCDSADILAELRHRGLIPGKSGDEPAEYRPRRHLTERPSDEPARVAQAIAIWHQARDPRGTPVERYLAGRSLSLPTDAAEVIRFHPRCPFKGEAVPAMVSLLRDIATDEPCGVHRTALLPSGEDRDRERGKAMLGRASGAAIKLTPDADVTMGLHIAEGIETALALLALDLRPAWAVCSAIGISRFPVVSGIGALTISVDHDQNGTGDRTARECAAAWHAAGREVRLIRSPIVGEDVADLIMRAS